MNKHSFYIILCFVTLKTASISEATITIKPGVIPSLQALATKSLFDFKDDQKSKELLNEKLTKKSILTSVLSFDGLIVEDLDLSDMYLKDTRFDGGKFINVQFTGADLRKTSFDRCKYTNVDLSDAILYCPNEDASKEEVYKNGFKLSRWNNHQDLLKLYIKLITDLDKDQFEINNEKLEHALCLNNFFLTLKFRAPEMNLQQCNLRDINLQNAHLGEFNLQGANLTNANLQKANLDSANLQEANLTNANLENAKLYGADLKGARLSQNVVVPDYLFFDTALLFNKWINGNEEEQEAYQKIVNARFNMFDDDELDNNILIQGIEKKKNNLKNVNLSSTNLQGADLTNANLQNADLSCAQLQGADLTNANLQNAELKKTQLQGTRLSENVVVPFYTENNKALLFDKWVNGNQEEQEAYQKIANARFNMIDGVDHNTLLQGIQKKKHNLKNVNLSNANLQGIDLTNANLQNADLKGIHLEGANLTNANLKNNYISNIHLEGANLTNASLQNTNLSCAHLEGANLTNANLQNTNLSCAHLEGARLSENVVVPFYTENNKALLFDKWVNGNQEEQESYQKIVDAQFNMFSGVDHNTLVQGIEKKKDNLKYIDLCGTNLQGADLMNANLQSAKLYHAYLSGANLTNINLQNAKLYKTHLEEANLTNANLQNSDLSYAYLENTNLIGANLANAKLSEQYYLPINCEDKDLPHLYQNCDDPEAKKLLENILKAKK